MTTTKPIKPTDKAIKVYYEALAAYARQDITHEMAVRSAFQNLLDDVGRRHGWTLIPELSDSAVGKAIRPDGTFRDDYYITRGYWEAKDSQDQLETEIRRKIAKGYPLSNTIFEDTRQAHLYQNGQVALKADLQKPQQLADLLHAFFSYTEPAHEDFEKAVDEFRQRVPDLARGLVEKIAEAHRNNSRFIEAFARFYELCRNSLNPNLREAAVDEMLVQHLLTERLIRTIFDNQDFTRRNVIAAEVEKVIDALVSRSFNRHQFLKSLDRFYLAIESAAATIESFAEKQHFLNTVYERFFQGYSVKVADTHGIVYTPQEIVEFMCASVVEVLEKEFGKGLGDDGVNILDPCTGTGNFIVNLIRRIHKKDLPRMYRRQLFANEVMLLPYYIAALNIEHAYYEATGAYEPFEGLCFVDTLDLAEKKQASFGFLTEENAARVVRQKATAITVIIGNPPYNMGQEDENDNNKNRKYPIVDARIRDTYAKDSTATLKNKLYDPYVKFLRWATDRLEGRPGVVCMVTNNSFVDQVALKNGQMLSFDRTQVRRALYRPFVPKFLYFDHLLNQRRYQQHHLFPNAAVEKENVIIWIKVGREWPYFALTANRLVDLLPQGGSQCFPFFWYNEDGTNRHDNITDWALAHFREHYGDKKITKWDIFYYVYGILQHPGYRQRFADNLKRELPRIPLASDFSAFSRAGCDLARMHLDYEKLQPWPLQWIETPGVPLSYKVEKMRLAKDKASLVVNESLTLTGIPQQVFGYRLGNRSALDWVIDQYQVSEDKRSGIRSDPNRPDDPEYIVRLVGQVVRVSMETVKIVDSLPADFGGSKPSKGARKPAGRE